MPGPSSSQEIEFELTACPVQGSPPAGILRRVQEGIHQEVNDAFAAAPHMGAETGGILLGRREQDRIVIEDFEPIPCEHRFGPSYRFSDADRELLRETLEWFRSSGGTGLSVLGFYRSHTSGDFDLEPQDEDLMRSHFSPDENLVLLVKPSLIGLDAKDFFLRCYRPAQPAPANAPAIAWPEPRPRLAAEPELSTGTRRLWYVGALALGLAVGAVGYVGLRPSSQGQPAATVTAPLPPAPAVSEAVVEGAPAPPPDLAGIHALLDRWSGALKQGDVRVAADCYAPVVSTYYSRHEVTRDAVRESLQQSRTRYGRLDSYRISGLGITPVSDTRAVATFRKHWRTGGRARSTGEEEERMTLVRNQGVWQISSEQTQTR
ncbi:MAG: hypothetical protein ABSH50_22740 [Bryobacteraceae bacterium]|jgi:hypothetical protein